MPKVKDALKRLGLIDQIVSDRRRKHLSKEELRRLVSQKMYGHPDKLSPSALDKDLQELRYNFGIVIHNNRRRGYFAETQHQFPERFKDIWGQYIDFNRADEQLKRKQESRTLRKVLNEMGSIESIGELGQLKEAIEQRLASLNQEPPSDMAQ